MRKVQLGLGRRATVTGVAGLSRPRDGRDGAVRPNPLDEVGERLRDEEAAAGEQLEAAGMRHLCDRRDTGGGCPDEEAGARC